MESLTGNKLDTNFTLVPMYRIPVFRLYVVITIFQNRNVRVGYLQSSIGFESHSSFLIHFILLERVGVGNGGMGLKGREG